MKVDWAIDLGTILSAASFFFASAGIFLSWRRHANRMDFTLQKMQEELSVMQKQLEKLADISTHMAVNDERFRFLERQIYGLRCVGGACEPDKPTAA